MANGSAAPAVNPAPVNSNVEYNLPEDVRAWTDEDVQYFVGTLHPDQRAAVLEQIAAAEEADLAQAKGAVAHLKRNKWRYVGGALVVAAAATAVVVVRRRSAAADAAVSAAEAAVGVQLS